MKRLLIVLVPLLIGTTFVRSQVGECVRLGEITANVNEVFSVTAPPFNAKGDDTKETATIQAAIDSMMKAIAGEGRNSILFFPRGVYNVDTLYLKGTPTYAGNAAYIHIIGAGDQNTILRVKHIEVGGDSLAEMVTFVRFADITIDTADGQPANGTLISLRRADRSWFERVVMQNSKGVNLAVVGSSVSIQNCNINTAGSDGILIDACNSITIQDSYMKGNTGYGVRIRFTGEGKGTAPDTLFGDPPVVSSDRVQVYIGGNNHFEYNQTGEILVDGADNVYISNNLFIHNYTVASVIEIKGVSRRSRIVYNQFNMRPHDGATKTGGSPGDFYYLKLGPRTYENVYGNNSLYHLTSAETLLDFKEQVSDSGRNYCLDYDNARFRQFHTEGGSPFAGWQGLVHRAVAPGQKRTNHILHSEGLTDSVWVLGHTGGAEVVKSVALGTPFSETDSSFELRFGTTYESVTTLTQTVSGIAVVPGEMWTFSLFMRTAYSTAAQLIDIRLRILDSLDNILADVGYRPKDNWERFPVTFVASDTLSKLKCQIYRRTRGGVSSAYLYAAQLNQGDLTPYIKTTGTPQSVEPGLVANSGHFNGGLTVVGKARGSDLSLTAVDSLVFANKKYVDQFVTTGAGVLGSGDSLVVSVSGVTASAIIMLTYLNINAADDTLGPLGTRNRATDSFTIYGRNGSGKQIMYAIIKK
jgi:hypothetical protein